MRLLPTLLILLTVAASALATVSLTQTPSSATAEGCPPGYRAEAEGGSPVDVSAGLTEAERRELAAAERDFAGESGVCIRTKHPESQQELALAARSNDLRRGTTIGELKPGAYSNALAERRKLQQTQPANVPGTAGSWEGVAKTPLKFDEEGYGEVNTLGQTDVAGRAGDFAYDPATDTLYSSSNAGGVWASNDGAKSWRSVGDGLPSQVVGSIGFSGAEGGVLIAVGGDSGFGGSSFAGAGAFRSADGGKTWTKSAGVPDGLLGFKVAVDPTNPSEIYLGTGGGLYRSTDAGRSYVNVKLPTSPECAGEPFKAGCQLANMVTDVAVQAPDTFGNAGGKVLAAVGWRAGTKQNADGTVQSPGNGLYASDNGEPGSFTKLAAPGFTPQEQIGRIELGETVGPEQNHNYVYALVQDAVKFNKGVPVLDANEPPPTGALPQPSVLDGVYVSADFGETWTKVTDATALAAPGNGSALTPVGVVVAQYGPGVQAWYNQFIEPDPTRQVGGIPTRLVFGLEEVWSSEVPDVPVVGPSSFKVIGRYYGGDSCQLLTLPLPACPTNRPPANSTTTHPDQHSAFFVAQGGSGAVALYVANDGGVFKQTLEPGEDFDNGRWGRGQVQGMHTLQPYDAQIAKDGVIYAGLQDNGEIKITPDGKQIAVYGGDAFYSVVHPDDSNIVFEEYVAGAVSVTNDGGKTWRSADPALKNGPFSTPMVGDPANPDHVLIAGRDVKLTTDGGNTTADSWQTQFDLGTQEAPGDANATGVNNQASALDLNAGNAYVGYCGHCDVITQGTPFRSGIATNVGGTWRIAKAQGLPERMVTSVTLDPADPKTVYVTLGNYNRRWGRPGVVNEDLSLLGKGHLFVSKDAGETFTDISGTLPDAPAYKVELRGQQLLVATEVGMFASTDRTGKQWAVLGQGLPNVPVYSIELQPGNPNRMIVATHGRGVWSYQFKDPVATGSQDPVGCAASVLATADAKPTGRGLRFTFSAPVTVNLLRVSKGRRISDKNAGRFGKRSKPFTWKGSKKLTDGYYVARFSIGGDDRRISLERRKGKFRKRGATDAKGTCALIRKIALNRPVFGGTANTPQKVVLRLREAAKVAVTVKRGSKTVKRIKTVNVRANRTARIAIAPKGLKRGDHKFVVTVTPKTDKAVLFTLTVPPLGPPPGPSGQETTAGAGVAAVSPIGDRCSDMGTRPLLAACAASLLLAPATAHAASETLGKTTLDVRILGGDRAAGFQTLRTGPGEKHVVRTDVGAKAAADRAKKRRSMAYFAQLSDFQLADEESPARVELLDQINSQFSSAFRPQEALLPFVIDASIRQVNAHTTSPVAQGNGRRAQMAYAITTGDNADNQQRNETEWVFRLLEGGPLDPNSGSSDPADYGPTCPSQLFDLAEGKRYTGVQDYDDYVESGDFYDPDQPAGKYAGFPKYPSLMDRAQQPFVATGLKVPSYVAVGNHDALVQGNEDANAAFEAVATGCKKAMLGTFDPVQFASGFAADPTLIPFVTSPTQVVQVPPDPKRSFVTLPEYRQIFKGGKQADGHGFGHVDAAELAASKGAASYYDFSPKPGVRMVALDSVANGGVAGITDRGNIDDPQYQWLDRVLAKADAAKEIVFVYSHHGPQSMDADLPDEAASPCVGPTPEADPNPGCDLDPRASTPLHLGPDVVTLLQAHPSVVAWVAGHSHVNDVAPYTAGGAGFWVIRTSAEADWPHQDRLIELMDNRDDTLSIFGTLIDNAAPVGAPAPGTDASGMSTDDLAALGRVIGYNDIDGGGGTGEGATDDHNVELLVRDPRDAAGTRLAIAGRSTRTLRAGKRSKLALRFYSVRNGRKVPLRSKAVAMNGREYTTDRKGRVTVALRYTTAGRRLLLATIDGHRPARLVLNVKKR